MKDDIIFVGKKPVMNYALAVVSQFNINDKVIIKARGKAISKAVDVAEVVQHRFIDNIDVSKITISTEKLTSEYGEINVSAIKIKLRRNV